LIRPLAKIEEHLDSLGILHRNIILLHDRLHEILMNEFAENTP
jgi:hypothetical protein